MSDKMIIRNCPAIYEYGKGLCCNDLKFDEHTLCQDCTDCSLKQIVELCTDAKKYGESFIRIDDILDVLDIQEVE